MNFKPVLCCEAAWYSICHNRPSHTHVHAHLRRQKEQVCFHLTSSLLSRHSCSLLAQFLCLLSPKTHLTSTSCMEAPSFSCLKLVDWSTRVDLVWFLWEWADSPYLIPAGHSCRYSQSYSVWNGGRDLFPRSYRPASILHFYRPGSSSY